MLQQPAIGVEALGFAIPHLALPLSLLPSAGNVDNRGYMSLCANNETIVDLAVRAGNRALAHWDGNLADIGLVVVATETAIDMSRPLSAWIMAELGLAGNIRSYEIKHACLGGTIAIRQACEWILSGNSKNKSALVICADIAMYAADHPGEQTQGAGAAALIINQPKIFGINTTSYYWSEPQFDFWRPVGEDYPQVNGRLTLSCYNKAVLGCFTQLANNNPEDILATLNNYKYLNFHVPFAKMVQTAVTSLGHKCKWGTATSNQIFHEKVLPTMYWNSLLGNSYTASLWFSVARSLTLANAGDNLLAFSFGSGCGAELLTLECISNQKDAPWVLELEQDIANRTVITYPDYQELRKI
jgi:hydroxymethylglutaryl-CoA synthase